MFNCGGNYTNTTNAGVFYTNGNNNSRTNTNANIGFRSALPQIIKDRNPTVKAFGSRFQGAKDLPFFLPASGR